MTKDLIERIEKVIAMGKSMAPDDRILMTLTAGEANSILWGNTEYVMSQVPAMARMVQNKMTGDAQ